MQATYWIILKVIPLSRYSANFPHTQNRPNSTWPILKKALGSLPKPLFHQNPCMWRSHKKETFYCTRRIEKCLSQWGAQRHRSLDFPLFPCLRGRRWSVSHTFLDVIPNPGNKGINYRTDAQVAITSLQNLLPIWTCSSYRNALQSWSFRADYYPINSSKVMQRTLHYFPKLKPRKSRNIQNQTLNITLFFP